MQNEDEIIFDFIKRRKDTVGIKKWREHYIKYLAETYLNNTPNINTVHQEFNEFTNKENIRFQLLDYKIIDLTITFRIQSNYTNIIYNLKMTYKTDYTIT